MVVFTLPYFRQEVNLTDEKVRPKTLKYERK